MSPTTVDAFFEGRGEAREIFDSVQAAVDLFGSATRRVSKSQVGFRRRRPFAATWVPGQYIQGKSAPLVLTIFLPYRAASERWKEVVEPSPGRFTHHVELAKPEDVDGEVRRLLKLAWEAAA